ncbi:MAG: hypothetical protein QNJ98_02005 [Planctomycetota bacterium]|nr:hypothetical protein [Planctomycetota bacterium]
MRVRLVVPGLRLEFVGDEALFDRTVAPLLDAAAGRRFAAGPTDAAADPAPAAAPGSPAGGDAEAPPESEAAAVESAAPAGFVPTSPQFSGYLKKVGARASDPDQQLVAFAFYLYNYEDTRDFDAETLLGCFEAVGLPTPEAIEERLGALCDRQRFLARLDGDGRFELTPKGVNYVKTRLLGAI